MGKSVVLTCLADGLLAARQAEGVHSQFATYGASQLDGNVFRRERAAESLLSACGTIVLHSQQTHLMSSA